MQIEADVTLPFPREKVFAAYRDRLVELVEYLPNIRSIRVRERKDLGDDVELVNEWEGGGDFPAVARSIISESMLRWTDYATWHGKAHTTDWRNDVHAFPGAVKSSGTNRFVDAGSSTKLEIRGQIFCDSTKIPGVPRLLSKTINGAVEKFLVGQVQVNLVAVAKGVGKLLERG